MYEKKRIRIFDKSIIKEGDTMWTIKTIKEKWKKRTFYDKKKQTVNSLQIATAHFKCLTSK